jgi:hypothetical protein
VDQVPQGRIHHSKKNRRTLFATVDPLLVALGQPLAAFVVMPRLIPPYRLALVHGKRSEESVFVCSGKQMLRCAQHDKFIIVK